MPLDYKKGQYRYNYYFLKAKNFYQQPVVKASANLILTLVIICLLAAFAVKPTLATIIALRRTLKERKEINQGLQKKIDALALAQINFAKISEDKNLIDMAVPEKIEFIDFASRLNWLIFTHHLTLNAVSFDAFDLVGESLAAENTQTFNLSVTGTFTEIKEFIKDLENIDRFIVLDSVSFQSGGEIKDAAVKVDINGNFFWLSRGEKKE